MFGKINAAHPTRAEVPEQLVLAEEEAFVFAVQKLVDVPLCEVAQFEKLVGDVDRRIGKFGL